MAVYTDGTHLIADSLDELHAFAAKIGLKRYWFQDAKKLHPHYDITTRRMLENNEFDPDDWCLANAEMFESIARMIRRGLRERDKEAADRKRRSVYAMSGMKKGKLRSPTL